MSISAIDHPDGRRAVLQPRAANRLLAAVAARDFEQIAPRLEPVDRALLTLRYGLDLEMADVAAALGMPLANAKSRVHRALRRLRASRSLDALPET